MINEAAVPGREGGSGSGMERRGRWELVGGDLSPTPGRSGPCEELADGCGDLGGVKRCLDGTSYKPDRRGNGKSERL